MQTLKVRLSVAWIFPVERADNLTRYWCANFAFDEGLKYGIEKNLWMMQYQFADEAIHEFQADGSAQIVRNWRRLAEIKSGDRLAAYLKKNRFFATGTVITPRRMRAATDTFGSIENYLAQKQSHKHKSGFVYYTPVFYEDFSDKWRAPHDKWSRWPQRIDVDDWLNFVPSGVEIKGLSDIPLDQIRSAVFEIDKRFFDEIERRLAAGCADDSEIEPLEKRLAKGQGFQLDSKLRKSLENYAMDKAKSYFAANGYDWEDCSKSRPFDLLCRRGREIRHVEVKGTQTDGREVILTKNEVEFARRNRCQMVLFIVHSISVAKAKDDYKLSGGTFTLIKEWDVDRGTLVPISFKHEP